MGTEFTLLEIMYGASQAARAPLSLLSVPTVNCPDSN